MAHKDLKGHPEVQEWLVDEIKDKPISVARAKVKQVEEDLKSGKVWAEKEGIPKIPFKRFISLVAMSILEHVLS